MTWTVRALCAHTCNGVAYNEGDIYTVDEQLLITLEQLRFAHRVSPTDNEAVS